VVDGVVDLLDDVDAVDEGVDAVDEAVDAVVENGVLGLVDVAGYCIKNVISAKLWMKIAQSFSPFLASCPIFSQFLP
jgi:hypothetical protein